MSARTVQVDLRGVRVSVGYVHRRGYEGGLNGPPEDDSVEIQSVMVVGSLTDIQALLDDDCHVELQNIVLARHRYNTDVARDEAADMKREESRLGHD